MKRRIEATLIVVLILVATGVSLRFVPSLHWRAQVLANKVNGTLDDLSWTELAAMLRPGSRLYIEDLAQTPNPFAVIRNPHDSPADRAAGQEIFRDRCSGCHGLNAKGGDHGPDLVSSPLKNGDSAWAIYRVVQRGVAGTSMVPVALSDTQRWQVVAFLAASRIGSIQGEGNEDGAARPPIDVSASRIEKSGTEPRNWLTYSGAYSGWRYSPLDILNRGNVSTLKLAWVVQFETTETVETSPIVVDGVIFLTEPPSNVVALDSATGNPIWTYRASVPSDVLGCCGRVNRGVAVLGDKVYVGTLDGRLVALDSRNGREVWQTRVADYKAGYSITVAPLAVRDKIIVGVSGGEYGIRGFLDAYDAASGKLAWRFYTVPGPGEAGSETWKEENAWRTGGGPTWVTGSFDPELGLLYWGVGNPSPDYDGTVRPGDNLFTNSVVALDVNSGQRVWHFQFTPHDEHDFDSNQTPVLVTKELGGKATPLILWANRNGFYYVLDRKSGRFVTGVPFAKQNWAERLDESGRPIFTALAHPTPKGVLTWPGTGATNWWPSSYSPIQDLLFVPYLERPQLFLTRTGESRRSDKQGLVLGSTFVQTGEPFHTGVRAIDPLTGRIVWDHEMPARTRHGAMGGVLTTAGGLVFVGDNTTFHALDTATGRGLWAVNLGGRINAAPISYADGSRQFVVIAAGNSVYAFAN